MWDLAVREEDYERADSLLRRRFTPERLPLGHRAILAIARRDSAGFSRILDEARAQSKGNRTAPEVIARYLEDFEAAERLAAALLASPRSQAARDSVHQFLGLLAAAQGQWRAARAEFGRAERTIPSARRLHALSATLPFLAVPDSELAALRAGLDAWDPASEAPEAQPGLASALRPHLRIHLRGLLSAKLGDDRSALDAAAQMERVPAPAEAATLVRDLSRIIRAEVALRRGRPEEALALLEPVRGEMPPELLALPYYAQEAARYIRAEALYRLGRNEEALRWFGHGFHGGPGEVVYLAPVHLRRAELLDRLGDRKGAVDHYGRFVRLWSECDPELRPAVDRARARLEALVHEPR